MRRLGMLTTVVVTVILVACDAGSPEPPAAGPVDVTGAWQMSSGSIDGVALAVGDDSPITLSVTGTQISGRSACNNYGGEIAFQEGRPRFILTSSTQMACAEPVMAVEAAFTAVLPRVVGAARDGDRLTLTGPGVELLFDRIPPVPLAQLLGTDWVLDSIVAGEVVSNVAGDPATLRLDADGTFTGSTGCRTFSGRWVEANGGIRPTDLGMDQAECPPDLAGQDGHVVGVLGGYRVTIDGRTLTLTGDRGDGLIYRAPG
ncbi:MAG TPA: META domain-containing protein [Candidatus Limnocylindrales bacterium]|nr:META domain-containing protein [Candidatus Limnocylindrales bacterium]